MTTGSGSFDVAVAVGGESTGKRGVNNDENASSFPMSASSSSACLRYLQNIANVAAATAAGFPQHQPSMAPLMSSSPSSSSSMSSSSIQQYHRQQQQHQQQAMFADGGERASSAIDRMHALNVGFGPAMPHGMWQVGISCGGRTLPPPPPIYVDGCGGGGTAGLASQLTLPNSPSLSSIIDRVNEI